MIMLEQFSDGRISNGPPTKQRKQSPTHRSPSFPRGLKDTLIIKLVFCLREKLNGEFESFLAFWRECPFCGEAWMLGPSAEWAEDLVC
jgi:hypothetical protein